MPNVMHSARVAATSGFEVITKTASVLSTTATMLEQGTSGLALQVADWRTNIQEELAATSHQRKARRVHTLARDDAEFYAGLAQELSAKGPEFVTAYQKSLADYNAALNLTTP